MKMMTREELMAMDKAKLVDMIFSLMKNKGVCEAGGECDSKPEGGMMDGGMKPSGSCKAGGSCTGGAMPAAGSCKS